MNVAPVATRYLKRWSDEQLDDMFREVDYAGVIVLSFPSLHSRLHEESL